MRKIILLLLLLLLFILTYIVSCGQTPKDVQATNEPAAEKLSEKASANLKAAGFSNIETQEVDGRLVLTGSASTPAERVRAGRSLDGLGVEVINHLRIAAPSATPKPATVNALKPAAQPVLSPKPLALLLQRGPNGTVATGYLTEALAKDLREGLQLAPTSKLETGSITTRSAKTAVQLAQATVRQLQNGSVRLQGSQMVVNGQIMSEPDAFRAALQRRLPAGYTLAARVNKVAGPQMASTPTITPQRITQQPPVPRPVAPTPRPVTPRPIAAQAPRAATTPVTPAANRSALPIAQTLPVANTPSSTSTSTTIAKPIAMAEQTSYQPASERTVQSPSKADAFADLPFATIYSADEIEAEAIVRAETYSNTYSSGYYTDSSSGDSTSSYIDFPASSWSPSDVVVTTELAQQPVASSYAVDEPFSGDCGTANLMPKGTIRFFHNSAKLTSSSRERMEIALPILRSCESMDIAVVGHTDRTGDREANMEISRARAQRIRQYLLDNGIDRNRLQVTAEGAAEPQLPNDSLFGRAMNRRVEIALLPQKR